MHPRPEPPVGVDAQGTRDLRPISFLAALALCAACCLLPAGASAQDADDTRPALTPQLTLALFPHSPPDADGILLAADVSLRRASASESTWLPAGTRLHDYREHWLRSQGRSYRLALWEATPPAATAASATVLALFAEDSLDPLDMLEVKTQPHTRFGDAATPRLGEDESFSIVNLRNTPGHQFSETALFHVHDGRLQPITSIFTQAMRGNCANAYQQIVHWSTEHDEGPYPRLKARMEMRPAPSDEHARPCVGRASRQQQIGQWRWHPARARYEAVGSEQFAQRTTQ